MSLYHNKCIGRLGMTRVAFAKLIAGINSGLAYRARVKSTHPRSRVNNLFRMNMECVLVNILSTTK